MYTSDGVNDYFALVLILEIIMSFFGPFCMDIRLRYCWAKTSRDSHKEQQVILII